MNKNFLTVITPVYNGERYIASTVKSVLENSKSIKLEYLVINDGSTDGTLNEIEPFKSQIKIINQENIGESASVTKGLTSATSEYVMILSSDDPLFTPKLFENVIEQFEVSPNLVAVYPDWRIIDEFGKVKKIIRVPPYSDELLIGRFRTLPGPGVIIRKSAALKIGGRRKKWVYVGDYDFWLRLSRIGELRHRPEVLAQWREHPKSTSVSKKGYSMAMERIQVINEFVNEAKITGELRRMALGNAYYMAARLGFFDDRIESRKLFKDALKIRGRIPEECSFMHFIFLITFPISKKILRLFIRA